MKKKSVFIVTLCSILTFMFSIPSYANTNSAYMQRISFFGDSTTYGMIHYIVNNDGKYGTPAVSIARNQVLASPDGTFYLKNIPTAKIRHQGKDYSLSEGFRIAAPDILIVTVGINGLPTWTEEVFLNYYGRLIDLIREATPKTQIVLQSVYPTAKSRDSKLESFTADKIDRLNGWIQQLAKERSLPYLNTASVLKGEDGWLIPSYHNGDGMHLNTNGFNAVLNYILNHPIRKGR